MNVANFVLCLDLLLCHSVVGAVTQSVERATPGKGSIPAVAARSRLVGSVSV